MLILAQILFRWSSSTAICRTFPHLMPSNIQCLFNRIIAPMKIHMGSSNMLPVEGPDAQRSTTRDLLFRTELYHIPAPINTMAKLLTITSPRIRSLTLTIRTSTTREWQRHPCQSLSIIHTLFSMPTTAGIRMHRHVVILSLGGSSSRLTRSGLIRQTLKPRTWKPLRLSRETNHYLYYPSRGIKNHVFSTILYRFVYFIKVFTSRIGSAMLL